MDLDTFIHAPIMGNPDSLALRGDLTIYATCERPDLTRVEIDHKGSVLEWTGDQALRHAPEWMVDDVLEHGNLLSIHEPNGFVSNGLDVVINKAFGVGGPPANIQTLIVAKSSVAVAATDTSILGGTTAPTFTGGSQNAISKALTAPAPAAAAANAITGGMSFTNTDVTGGANFWPINRVGLLNVAASTNLGLIDVIGNTASQADPYSRTFSVDFSSAGVFTLSPQITVTLIRRVADMPVL